MAESPTGPPAASPAHPTRNIRVVGGLLLAGWALYLTVVTASNLSDLISSLGWEHWTFRSGNLDFIAKATEIYVSTQAVNQVLLAGVLIWEGAAAFLLWRAAVSRVRTGPTPDRARTALVVVAMLWFSFAVATELFVAYDRGIDENAFWTLEVAVLATLAVLELITPPGSTVGAPDADPCIRGPRVAGGVLNVTPRSAPIRYLSQ